MKYRLGHFYKVVWKDITTQTRVANFDKTFTLYVGLGVIEKEDREAIYLVTEHSVGNEDTDRDYTWIPKTLIQSSKDLGKFEW